MNTVLVCACGKTFVVHHDLPTGQTHCPTCLDKRQHRRSVVLSRERVAEFAGVRIDSLPGEWQAFRGRKKDREQFVIDVPGSVFGSSWSGRIVVRAYQIFRPGDTVLVRVMRAVHEVRVKYESRQRNNWQGAALGESPVSEYQKRIVLPYHNEEGELEQETREYIVLESCEREPEYRMVYASSRTKTTLKGLGAQYEGRLDASKAVWSVSCSGGMRSGRAETVAVLAVLPLSEKIVLAQSGHSGSGDSAGYNWEREI